MSETNKGPMTAAQAWNRFSEVVDRAARGKERVLLTRRGKPVVAVVPMEDVRLLEGIEDRQDLEDFRVARDEAEREGTVPLDEVLKEFGVKR